MLSVFIVFSTSGTSPWTISVQTLLDFGLDHSLLPLQQVEVDVNRAFPHKLRACALQIIAKYENFLEVKQNQTRLCICPLNSLRNLTVR